MLMLLLGPTLGRLRIFDEGACDMRENQHDHRPRCPFFFHSATGLALKWKTRDVLDFERLLRDFWRWEGFNQRKSIMSAASGTSFYFFFLFLLFLICCWVSVLLCSRPSSRPFTAHSNLYGTYPPRLLFGCVFHSRQTTPPRDR